MTRRIEILPDRDKKGLSISIYTDNNPVPMTRAVRLFYKGDDGKDYENISFVKEVKDYTGEEELGKQLKERLLKYGQ